MATYNRVQCHTWSHTPLILTLERQTNLSLRRARATQIKKQGYPVSKNKNKYKYIHTHMSSKPVWAILDPVSESKTNIIGSHRQH